MGIYFLVCSCNRLFLCPRFFSDLPLKTGKVAVITGGSRGIGLEVVRMLMQCDLHVVIGIKNSLVCPVLIEKKKTFRLQKCGNRTKTSRRF